jgi:hypothetical protein
MQRSKNTWSCIPLQAKPRVAFKPSCWVNKLCRGFIPGRALTEKINKIVSLGDLALIQSGSYMLFTKF